MRVSKDSWHFRWYQRWQRWKARTDVTYKWLLQTKEEPQLDLCHYFWIIVLFAPWRGFWQGSYRWNLLRPSTATGALIALGGLSFLSVEFPIYVLEVVGFIVAGVVVAILVLVFGYSLEKYKWHRPLGRAIVRPFKSAEVEEREPKMRIFWEFAKAKKRKVCPLITVVGDDDDDDMVEPISKISSTKDFYYQ